MPPPPFTPTKLPLQKPQMSEPACLQAEAPSPRKREHDVPKPKNPIILLASILTRKVEGKSSKKFGFWRLQKTEFWREPQSEPQANLRVQKAQEKLKKHRISCRNPALLWQRTLIMIPHVLDAPHFAGGVHFQFVGCILSVSDAPQGVDAAPRQSLQLFLLRQHRIMGQGDSA